MSARPKNEAVIDRLRRLQESRAEREKQKGFVMANSEQLDVVARRTQTPPSHPVAYALSPSTADRVAMLRSNREDTHRHEPAGLAGTVPTMPSPQSIYHNRVVRDEPPAHTVNSSRPATSRTLVKRGPVALAEPKPGWVGSTNAKSKSTPVRNSSNPATGRRTPTPKRSASVSTTGSNRPTSVSKSKTSTPMASHRPAPIIRGPTSQRQGGHAGKDGYVNTPQTGKAVERRRPSTSETADAYEYDERPRGKGFEKGMVLGNSGSGPVTSSSRFAKKAPSSLVPVTAAPASLGSSNSVVQRQLFGELQHVVVQLSQTALGDQQQIAHLIRKVDEYEHLIGDQEKMIEELEALNVKLVAERNSLRAFQDQGATAQVSGDHSGSLVVARRGDTGASHQLALRPPQGGVYEDDTLDSLNRSGGGAGNQRTIIASMIQTIKQEKRQRLLVEEKSSKIIAEQQLAIHRLELQVKELAKLDLPISSRILVGGRESPMLPDAVRNPSDVLETHEVPMAVRRGTPTSNASMASAPRELQPPSEDQSEVDDLRPIASAPETHRRRNSIIIETHQELPREGSTGLVSDAKQAFADALAAAGVPSATVPEGLRKPLSELAQLSSNYYSVPPYSTNTNPPLHSMASQPYIPRLVLNQHGHSVAPTYTVAPAHSRDTSYSRTHSVVAMSDMADGAPQGAPASPLAPEHIAPQSHTSVALSLVRADSYSKVSNPSLTDANLARNAALGGERGISLRDYIYRDGLGIESNYSADHPDTPATASAFDRSSPEPHEASSVLHTARSLASHTSQRSAFLRGANAAGASLGPDSPPRGAIGTTAAMDRILEDIKRRHNL